MAVFKSSPEWFILEYQAVLRWYDSAPLPNPSPFSRQQVVSLFPVFLCVAGRVYWRERGEGGGGGRFQIIRPRESLVLYKTFNTLWRYLLKISTPCFSVADQDWLIPDSGFCSKRIWFRIWTLVSMIKSFWKANQEKYPALQNVNFFSLVGNYSKQRADRYLVFEVEKNRKIVSDHYICLLFYFFVVLFFYRVKWPAILGKWQLVFLADCVFENRIKKSCFIR
jgi:hypothetical protein